MTSCSNTNNYTIEKKFKSIVNDENCLIEYYYPKLSFEQSNKGETTLNQLLEEYADYEHYQNTCEEGKTEKRSIKGDYTITLKAENLLSIEFLTSIINSGDGSIDSMYHSIVLNPKKVEDKAFSYFQNDPKFILPNFDRGDLYNYVKNYNIKKSSKINLRAYESKSNYVLTWGLSKDHFLLYVGGEGEWYGTDKIKIPLSQLEKY